MNSFHNYIDSLRPRHSLVFSLFVNKPSTVPEASKPEAIEAVAIEIVVKTRRSPFVGEGSLETIGTILAN